MENYTKLKMILNLLGGDGDKVEADVKAKMQAAENGEWPFPVEPYMAPFLTEDYCIGSALRGAILDTYFGSMSRETAITLRDTLGEYGSICLYGGCEDLMFNSLQVANNYNARHEDDKINPMYTGYQPFEI